MKSAFFWLLMMLGLCGPAFSQEGKLLVGGVGNSRIYIIDKKSGDIEWGGHSGKSSGSEAQIFELDSNGKVVWSLNQHAKTGNISAVYI